MVDDFDRTGEYLRVCDHYRQLSDGELLSLARQQAELAEVAQQALAGEISHRKLKEEPAETPAIKRPLPPPDIQDPDDPNYDEDKRLVTICTVWSMADARQVQNLLDTARIPFYIGPEKASSVDDITSDFANGLDVNIMSIGMPWARDAMKYYDPRDDQTPKEPKEIPDASVLCPKCHSSEVVLEEMAPIGSRTSPQLFKWTCDACGLHWEDDGIEPDPPGQPAVR